MLLVDPGNASAESELTAGNSENIELERGLFIDEHVEIDRVVDDRICVGEEPELARLLYLRVRSLGQAREIVVVAIEAVNDPEVLVSSQNCASFIEAFSVSEAQ